VPVSSANFLQLLGWGGTTTDSGVAVNIESALTVPAVWAATNFLSGTIAGLPLMVYKRTPKGRSRVKSTTANQIPNILNEAANDELSAFDWLKYTYDRVFTGGRGLTYIERNNSGQVVNLWPMDPTYTTIRLEGGRRVYTYMVTGMKPVVYKSSDVIDISFMIKENMVDHRSPLINCSEAIGMAIAATRYGANAFNNGGMPPAVIQGPFNSVTSATRASDDITSAMAKLGRLGRQLLALPIGHEIKPIGIGPKDMQLIELERFCIEQVSRIYSLPPVFLQDLTHGTFSNTEQQDLHLVKHTIKRWVEQAEQEITLKLFGRGSPLFVEFNLDGLLRGDIKTRMEAHAISIQNAVRTPNEVREIENMEPMEGGDVLLIQGATVPLGTQPAAKQEPVPGQTVGDPLPITEQP
jgi:HK97 family phage portal protein